MSKIISMQESASRRFLLVTLDDGKALKVPPTVAGEFGLYCDMELCDEELLRLKKACSAASARERAVRTISACNISEQALAQRLVEKGESKEDAEEAVSWLKELSLLDDEKTAMQIAASAQARGYGVQRLKGMLYEKKIPKQYWQRAIDSLQPPDDFLDRFLSRRFAGEDPDQKSVDKAVQALARRGFSWPQISAALSRYQSGLSLNESLEDFS